MSLAQKAPGIDAGDLEEDCRTLLGVASMGIELGAIDHSLVIADAIARAAPGLREASFAAVLFRMMNGQLDDACRDARDVRDRFPNWTTARILVALTMKSAGTAGWQQELEHVVDQAESDSDVEFARALLAL